MFILPPKLCIPSGFSSASCLFQHYLSVSWMLSFLWGRTVFLHDQYAGSDALPLFPNHTNEPFPSHWFSTCSCRSAHAKTRSFTFTQGGVLCFFLSILIAWKEDGLKLLGTLCKHPSLELSVLPVKSQKEWGFRNGEPVKGWVNWGFPVFASLFWDFHQQNLVFFHQPSQVWDLQNSGVTLCHVWWISPSSLSACNSSWFPPLIGKNFPSVCSLRFLPTR